MKTLRPEIVVKGLALILVVPLLGVGCGGDEQAWSDVPIWGSPAGQQPDTQTLSNTNAQGTQTQPQQGTYETYNSQVYQPVTGATGDTGTAGGTAVAGAGLTGGGSHGIWLHRINATGLGWMICHLFDARALLLAVPVSATIGALLNITKLAKVLPGLFGTLLKLGGVGATFAFLEGNDQFACDYRVEVFLQDDAGQWHARGSTAGDWRGEPQLVGKTSLEEAQGRGIRFVITERDSFFIESWSWDQEFGVCEGKLPMSADQVTSGSGIPLSCSWEPFGIVKLAGEAFGFGSESQQFTMKSADILFAIEEAEPGDQLLANQLPPANPSPAGQQPTDQQPTDQTDQQPTY